jgi:haloalkane dehalogenase
MTKAESWRPLFPFASRYVHTPAGRIHYVDEGPREGAPILMAHGNPTWAFHYRRLIAGLMPARRCIAWDHLGCGLSDKPETFTGLLEEHIEHARRLVDSLSLDRFDLVVHDWGGAIALGMASRIPERVGRILVLNTAAFPSRRVPWRIRLCRTRLPGKPLLLGANAFLRGALVMAVRRPLPPRVRAGYRYPFRDRLGRLAAWRFVRDIPLERKHPSAPVLEQVGERIGMLRDKPMLICWGLRDFCFDEKFLRQWRERFPHARVRTFEDAGHWVLEDAAASIVNEARAFFGVEGAGGDDQEPSRP